MMNQDALWHIYLWVKVRICLVLFISKRWLPPVIYAYIYIIILEVFLDFVFEFLVSTLTFSSSNFPPNFHFCFTNCSKMSSMPVLRISLFHPLLILSWVGLLQSSCRCSGLLQVIENERAIKQCTGSRSFSVSFDSSKININDENKNIKKQ